MNEWQHHFGEVFFRIWKEGGFPNPEAYLGDYLKQRTSYNFQADYLKASYNTIPALESNLMNSVYGFGVLHGELFAQLLGIDAKDLNEGADWCGRFNLGISLFDYLTDETSKGIEELMSLNALKRFTNEAATKDKALPPTEEFLNSLISDVLEAILKLKNDHSKSIMNHLKDLFKAQVLLSKQTLNDSFDQSEIYKALQLKSAGPFSVKAKYVVGKNHNDNSELLRRSEGLGAAIGSCYWLIDDAKDVLIDLEANQWNVFLHKIAEHDPDFFQRTQKADFSKDLSDSLISHNIAETISQECIDSLNLEIKQLAVNNNVLVKALGIIGASLWHWYKY